MAINNPVGLHHLDEFLDLAPLYSYKIINAGDSSLIIWLISFDLNPETPNNQLLLGDERDVA